MSDSNENLDILRDIKLSSYEPLAKRVTDSISCEELAAASADVDLEQPLVPPTSGPDPQKELHWRVFVCVGINSENIS